MSYLEQTWHVLPPKGWISLFWLFRSLEIAHLASETNLESGCEVNIEQDWSQDDLSVKCSIHRTPVQYSIHYLCNVNNTPSSDSWCCFSSTAFLNWWPSSKKSSRRKSLYRFRLRIGLKSPVDSCNRKSSSCTSIRAWTSASLSLKGGRVIPCMNQLVWPFQYKSWISLKNHRGENSRPSRVFSVLRDFEENDSLAMGSYSRKIGHHFEDASLSHWMIIRRPTEVETGEHACGEYAGSRLPIHWTSDYVLIDFMILISNFWVK